MARIDSGLAFTSVTRLTGARRWAAPDELRQHRHHHEQHSLSHPRSVGQVRQFIKREASDIRQVLGLSNRSMIAWELIARVARALSEQPWWLGLVALITALACHPKVRSRVQSAPVSLVIIAIGLAWAWSLIWASDDAYITFRYATNFANGHGLVFNLGERVEGYTDFLWAVIIALFIKLRAPAVESAILLSLASFVMVLLLTKRLAARGTSLERTLPLAMIFTAANYTMASFATSGLETMFAAMWVLVALDCAEENRPFLSGLAGVLATMCHPDHLLFYAALGLGALWSNRNARFVVRYAAPFVLIFVPYFLWRWNFYGDLMPNTYYAKSGGDAYFSQGNIYLLVSVIGYGVLAALPLVLVGLRASLSTITGRFVAIGVPLYLFYVAKIGGDFMLGRLFTPVFPLVFIIAERGLRHWLSAKRSVAIAAAFTAVAALAIVPVRIIKPGEIYNGIADERTFTPITQFSPLRSNAGGYDAGQSLHSLLTVKGLSPMMAVWSLGMVSYYSELPTFDLRGLTSRSVAHSPIAQRGRPGHEKLASLGQVIDAKVDLSVMPFDPAPYDSLTRVVLGNTAYFLAKYKPELVPTLREYGLPDYRAWADTKVAALPSDDAQLDCDLVHLREYYFSVNDDQPRRSALLGALAQRSAARAYAAPLVLDSADPATKGWVKVQSESFDSLSGWAITGDGAAFLTDTAPYNQLAPSGQHGRFIDSFLPNADASMGRLESPAFELAGDAITFSIGGGQQPTQATVSLVVNGAVVRTATGCNTERLGLRAWDVREFKGQSARVRIDDSSAAGWGHVLVDDVTLWRRAE